MKKFKSPLDDSQLEEVIEVLENDGTVVYPTDTLYGLGANPFSEDAVRRMFEIKRRPLDQPVSIAVYDISQVREYVELTDLARHTTREFLPGPLTILLKKKDPDSLPIVSSRTRIGIRILDHPVALPILENFGPITSTSANLHHYDLPCDVEEAIKQLGDTVDIYIDSGRCRYGQESTVLDVSSDSPKIIRPGVISHERLRINEE
ncbi:MAG: threonylcarbamoyl-AMP synthase [Methanobacteriota archaeon]|nr:MAG: threonylcarbamoyl-AMP synthase [Euryarchaeota archaeon]